MSVWLEIPAGGRFVRPLSETRRVVRRELVDIVSEHVPYEPGMIMVRRPGERQAFRVLREYVAGGAMIERYLAMLSVHKAPRHGWGRCECGATTPRGLARHIAQVWAGPVPTELAAKGRGVGIVGMVERLRNSKDGNPSVRLTLRDGRQYVTAPDSQSGYDASGLGDGELVVFRVDSHGRVTHLGTV